MERKIRYKLHPVRLIFYLLFWAGLIFVYDVLRSYFLWLLLIMITMFPVLSVAGAVYLCGRLTPELQLERTTVVKSGEALMELHLENTAWWVAFHSQMQFIVSNTFLEQSSELTVQMPVTIHGRAVLKLPFLAADTGRYTVSCEMLGVQDAMGFLECQKRIALSKELFVLPRPEADAEMDITGFWRARRKKKRAGRKEMILRR